MGQGETGGGRPVKTALTYLAVFLCAMAATYLSVRYSRALDDLHSLATDLHAIRSALAPEQPKMRLRVDYGDRERQQPEVTTL